MIIEGYLVAPYLFFAPLLQMLFQVAANQFLVIKKTWPNLFILSSGAVANIIINLLLIPILGIEGAAIATLIGYLISNIICVIVLLKMRLMVISKRFLVLTSLMLLYFVTWRLYFKIQIGTGAIAFGIIIFVTTLLYKRDVIMLFNSIKESKINK